ncbi:hypothetical protein HPB51_008063 [Rhipicephalus microplus]|uniref:Uncharacterized protein n=1 Tax=Rhipicephalus microplus TaxID=6941 RepID=A0A9J6EFX6_RHIMP|nr:hypothetical protein HPB51_008063 [Rhipicephalus microplus]
MQPLQTGFHPMTCGSAAEYLSHYGGAIMSHQQSSKMLLQIIGIVGFTVQFFRHYQTLTRLLNYRLSHAQFTFAVTLALLGVAVAAPAEEKKEEEAEGRIGFGGGAFGSGFNRGGSFGVGSQGSQYGQGGFGYNVGGSNRRDYGNAATYGDRESFGLSQNAGHNRQFGQGSYGNRHHNNAFGAGGNRFASGGGYLG